MYTASRRYLLIFPILALVIASLNCSIDTGSSNNTLEQTQVAMSVLQTSVALQSSGVSATSTAMAIPPTPLPTNPPPPTAIPPTPIPTQPIVVIPISQATQSEPLEPTASLPPVDFQAQMKEASILVYEDIVTDPSEYQYVKRTLDAMGLKYQWDGNAIGKLKSHMLANAPNGQPWDLVILAIETRSTVSGEYFDYLNDVLNQGTSVIVEAWHLDAISQGAVSPILVECGVEVYPYGTKTGTALDAVVWPLPNDQHPLMREPNSGMTFTKARDKWLWSLDLGSKMALTGQGDAQFLLGTKATEPGRDGVLAVCMGGQLVIQTFSSHSFSYATMYPLWENYIYNALKTRFTD